MKELTETNQRLAEVRKARKAAALMRAALEQDPKRSAAVTVTIGMPIGHFVDTWPEQMWKHPALDDVLRTQLAENLTTALGTADNHLRAEERRLCEDLVRLAAKTAAAGL